MKEIGNLDCIISSIKTRVDGSVAITLDALPEDKDTINKLMNRYLADDRRVYVAFVEVAQ
jgi:hypothetical protein